jgi:hypothetical protein
MVQQAVRKALAKETIYQFSKFCRHTQLLVMELGGIFINTLACFCAALVDPVQNTVCIFTRTKKIADKVWSAEIPVNISVGQF